nr:unnamed protein product [Callosobruchus chinensis]
MILSEGRGKLCNINKIPHPFSNGESADRAWFDHFMTRHKDILSMLKPSATSITRAKGFNKEAISSFFDIIESELKNHSNPADRVFNVDESGISVVQSKIPRFVGLKGKRQIGALTAAERGGLVTCACCMSASAIYIPPLLFFSRKNMTSTLIKECLPPHTTHTLQPLDKSFMGPLKHYYSENIRQFMLHSQTPLEPYDLAELLGKAYIKCQTGSIAMVGFIVTRIFPLSRLVFSDIDFAPSEETDFAEINLESLKACKGQNKFRPSSICKGLGRSWLFLISKLDMLGCHFVPQQTRSGRSTK